MTFYFVQPSANAALNANLMTTDYPFPLVVLATKNPSLVGYSRLPGVIRTPRYFQLRGIYNTAYLGVSSENKKAFQPDAQLSNFAT